MKKKLSSLLLMMLFSVLWVLLLIAVPDTLNKFSIFKISFWTWFITFLILNIFYFISGLFKKFIKIKKVWISLSSGILLFYAFYYLLNGFISLKEVQSAYFHLAFPLFLSLISLILSRDKKSVINRIALVFAFAGTGIYLYQRIAFNNLNGILFTIGSALLFAVYLYMINKDRNKIFISVYFSVITCFVISVVYLLIKSSFSLPSLDDLLTFGLMGLVFFLLTIFISYSYRLSNNSKTVVKAYSLVLVYFSYFELFINGTYQMKDLISVILIALAIVMTFFDRSN